MQGAYQQRWKWRMKKGSVLFWCQEQRAPDKIRVDGILAPLKRGRYWEIHPRCPTEISGAERVDLPFYHHLQGRIGFNTVNPSLSTLPRKGLMMNRMVLLHQHSGAIGRSTTSALEHGYNSSQVLVEYSHSIHHQSFPVDGEGLAVLNPIFPCK